MNKQTKKLAAAVIVLVIAVVFYFAMMIWNQTEEAKANEDTSVALIDLSSDDVAAFSYVYGDETISFVKEDDIWYLESDTDFPVDQDTIEGKLTSALSETYTTTIEISADDLADYGLDAPTYTITITDSDGNETLYEVGDLNSTLSEYYCRVNEGTTLYLISSNLGTMLFFDIYDVADMSDFPDIDVDTLIEVIVSNAETTVELTEDDDEFTDVNLLYFSGDIDYDCDDLSVYGLDDPAYTIIIRWAETDDDEEEDETEEEEEETYAEEDIVETILYVGDAYSSSYYYVYVEGSTEVHTMSSSYLSDLLAVVEPEEDETTLETEVTEE